MKQKQIYPTLLLLLFALFIFYGKSIFGYSAPVASVPTDSADVKYEYIPVHITLSPYDNYFRLAGDSLELDWTLIAAIAYTESHFDSTAVSNVGARGVMQMMPQTLRGLNVPDSLHSDNRSNIIASAQYLKQLFRIFRNIDYNERINFVLASYNAGYGHVWDAMRLAKKYGYDNHRWVSNVDSFLIKKSRPEFYNDSVCRNGKFNDWQQTLSFVEKVRGHWERFSAMQHHYSDSIAKVIATDTLKLLK